MSDSSDLALRVLDLRIETVGGLEIVGEISFALRRGEVLALVGESGCGKTSIAMALLGHARAGTRIASGSVWLEGTDVLALSERKLRKVRGSKIAYVPQDPTSGLNPRHRIGSQIAETLLVHGTPPKTAFAATRELVKRVRLPDEESFLRRYPFELSGGQQQRVAIAMALVGKPLVAVLDEPTTGLDVTTQASILSLLVELGRELGTAFVYVTHDLAVVDNLAHRVAVLYAGRIVESGPREAVFQRPAHPYSAMLLDSVPRLRIRRELTGIAGTAPAPGARPTGCFFEPRCPIAFEHCKQEFPNLTTVSPGHAVRCWRPRQLVAAGLSGAGTRPEHDHGTPLLSVVDLTASYGRGSNRQTVVQEVSFEIPSGRCLALVGESGSGKTTIGRCVAGLHVPDGGVIRLAGQALASRASERTQSQRQAIQIVFQNPDRSLNPAETIGAAIARPRRLFGLPASGRVVVDLLERVRLPSSYVDRYPREISGGEKQRVAIARSLAAQPKLLVCDEITSALDVSVQAAIIALLEELQRDGLSLLFITHNLPLVHSFADWVVVLESGQVRESGDSEAIIRNPTHPYTRSLLAAAPELRASPSEVADGAP